MSPSLYRCMDYGLVKVEGEKNIGRATKWKLKNGAVKTPLSLYNFQFAIINYENHNQSSDWSDLP